MTAPTNRASPADLAAAVFQHLSQGASKVPSEPQLRDIFEILFYASLQVEEGQSITCNLAYLDPKDPALLEPLPAPHNRWDFTAFTNPFPFAEAELIKLAKATDPRSSSIAVFPGGDGALCIWGLVDQGNSFFGFIHHEQQRPIDPPGLFQASIEGIGRIAAYADLSKIAELTGSLLLPQQVPVFEEGPIHEWLVARIEEEPLHLVFTRLEERYGRGALSGPHLLVQYWLSVLCRLILRVRSYRHGGTLLLARAWGEPDLKVKYDLHYLRLSNAIPKFMFQSAVHAVERQRMNEWERRSEDGEGYYPKGPTLEALASWDQLAETEREIDDCVWFISTLSRVDGLVLMDPYLGVHGFGAEIKVEQDPLLYLAGDARGSTDRLQEIDAKRYGMRHRSVIRWVWGAPQSIGFVVSQDGHVRAIRRVDDAVILWDNIKLQRAIDPPLPASMAGAEFLTPEELAERMHEEPSEEEFSSGDVLPS
jgi:hypothetical protein